MTLNKKVNPIPVRNNMCCLNDAGVVVLCGSYLHDLRNGIDRIGHHVHGCAVANAILDRPHEKIWSDDAAQLFR